MVFLHEVQTVADVDRLQIRQVLAAPANVLGGMSGLGRVLRPTFEPFNVSRAGQPGGDEVAVDIVGPLCTPLDRLATAAPMPVPAIADLLAIPNVGAYGATAPVVSRRRVSIDLEY